MSGKRKKSFIGYASIGSHGGSRIAELEARKVDAEIIANMMPLNWRDLDLMWVSQAIADELNGGKA